MSLCYLILLATSVAQAMVMEPKVVTQALAQAELVADVRVLEVESQPDATFYARRLARVEIVGVSRGRGWQSGDRLTIEAPGGERDGLGVFVTGYPRLYRDRSYRVYLKAAGNGNFTFTGGDESVLALENTRQFSRNRVDGSNGDGTGAFLYWDDNAFPIPYYISSPTFLGHPEMILPIDRSFQAWSRPENVKVDFLPMGCTTQRKNENDGINAIILVKDHWDFDHSAIAITRNFYVSGAGPHSGLILDSDILLNAVDHSFSVTGESGKHDVQNIVTHEVGHFIGLGHETGSATEPTMVAVASPGETKKRTLETSDLAGMTAGYAGVTNKQPIFEEASCAVAIPGAGSCLAVHRRETSAADTFWFFLMWAIALTPPLLVRVFQRHPRT